ncbi:putative reverse transcriptase domain-containing protein, partial [Tanacetum coccineum]
MEENMTKTREDYSSRIARPKFDEKARFELKGQFLKKLCNNTFIRSDNEDENEYIERFVEIADLFTIPDVTQDQIMLCIFPISLTGAASRWIRNETAVGCESCNRPHYTKNYPLKEEGKTLEEAYYTQFGVSFPQGERYRAAALGFYQRDNGNLSFNECCNQKSMSLNQSTRDSDWENEQGHLIEYGNDMEEINATMNSYCLTILDDALPLKEKTQETVKRPKGIAENVLVGIIKFVFPVDFIVLDMPEDINVPLILERPFLSTAHAKIDVFERKITLRIRNDKIVFKSDSPTSNIIKKVYVLGLRERMKLDLEARLMGEALILNRSQDLEFGDLLELNDLNGPLELRRNQEVNNLGPKIKEGEVIDEPM